ncbi:MAG: hypothetical protein AAGD28_11030 [Bacteroidota bacterium]
MIARHDLSALQAFEYFGLAGCFPYSFGKRETGIERKGSGRIGGPRNLVFEMILNTRSLSAASQARIKLRDDHIF